MSDRILIVDDEPSILEILCQILTPLGYACSVASSPVRALDMLQEDKFSLLLTDVKMPEMNGIDVVKRAREIDPTLSIIVVTALTDVSNAIQAIRAGADDYILKPFNIRDISNAVSSAMKERDTRLDALDYQTKLEKRISSAASDLEDLTRQLRQTKQYLENLLNSTHDAIFTIRTDGRIEFVNSGAYSTLGYQPEELQGHSAAELLQGGQDEVDFIRQTLSTQQSVKSHETELRHKDGHLVPVIISVSLVPNADGKPMALLAICKDITEQKRLQHELREMSVRDSLTGLYNQRHFYEVLEREIERARRQKRPLSLLLLDVDRFKGFNDTRGHLEGDHVLRTVGQIILECTRGYVDVGFRYGGDEFTVILPEASEDQAKVIAERIRASFRAKEFDDLSLSIGLMEYRDGMSMRVFIQNADKSMYAAKRSGGNQVEVYRHEPGAVPEEVG